MSHTLEHRACRLVYDIEGTGPPVLFIQGVGVHGAGWRPQVDALSSQFTSLSFDNRGMGRSQPMGSSLTVEQMADDARAIIDAAGFDAAHIVGHSLGGLVAICLALEHRARIKSLSLLCTFGRGSAAAPMDTRMLLLGMGTRVGTRRMRRRAFLKLVMPPAALKNIDLDSKACELAALFGHDLADQPPVVSHQLKAMRAADYSSRLGELAGIPTLVVSAAHDLIAPPRAGAELANGIPDSRYIELADGAHGLPITHAALVNDLLTKHLKTADMPRLDPSRQGQ